MQYYHAALRSSLAWTVAPADRAAFTVRADRIHSLAAKLPRAKDDLDD